MRQERGRGRGRKEAWTRHGGKRAEEGPRHGGGREEVPRYPDSIPLLIVFPPLLRGRLAFFGEVRSGTTASSVVRY